MIDAVPFIEIPRARARYRPVAERVKDHGDVAVPRDEAQSRQQALRCVNCGLPFCHWTCPLGNAIPAWNAHVARGEWRKAVEALQATNPMPEVTGRVCPAMCEPACVLSICWEAVTIRENELAVIEYAFAHGLVRPRVPRERTGRSVAVVGSGPAGLACADQVNQAGHRVVVFERDAKIGGLLRYGIPDFKLEKWILDRRLGLWEAEGIEFRTSVEVGRGYPFSRLRDEFDAVCLAGGCRVPRDLPIEGRSLRGIHFALDYLAQANRLAAGEPIPEGERIDANGKRVMVIGGGDTGADCVGTAHRQGARQVLQVEILPRPPQQRGPTDLWPDFPAVLRTSTSHEEGGVREWAVLAKRFLGGHGAVRKVSCARVQWGQPEKGKPATMREIPGTEFECEADLVLLAMGFVGAEPRWSQELGIAVDARGCLQTDQSSLTSVPGVFAAGDMRRGQSLVAHAISDGRQAAHAIRRYLLSPTSARRC